MSESLRFYENSIEPQDAAAQILEGLSAEPKMISPKFFYDELGSNLFTEITRQPEYYPTRIELELFANRGQEMAEVIGTDSLLIEFGSGSSQKIRLLLENLKPRIYAPCDISREYLAAAASEIAAEYPWLEVRATCLDYTKPFELPFEIDAPPIGFFPGSSIGNFEPSQAESFLRRVRRLVGEEGGLLIGVDMKKDVAILNAAYNDSEGITARFNLNLLTHLNREFSSTFELSDFKHVALYNENEGCIQMFLESLKEQEVQVSGTRVGFGLGERLHTENSYKYSADEFLAMADRAGFGGHHCWQDESQWFSVFYLY